MRFLALTVIFCSVLAAAAAAASAAPSPYLRNLSQASSHLRVAIEIRPEALAEYLRSSELVCEAGDRAAKRGDEARAAADWTTLSQLVDELDRRELSAIDAAYVRADENLVALQRRFSLAWQGQAENVRDLKLGVARTREGIGVLRRAMDRIAVSFSEWERHDCIGAVDAIEAGVRRISPGLDKVNHGMQRLWGLPHH